MVKCVMSVGGEVVATLDMNEVIAHEQFNDMLSDGFSCVEALAEVRKRFEISDEFADWLIN